MNRIAKFEKVSLQQFWHDFPVNYKSPFELSETITIEDAYDNIKLPTRATVGSAGYDFATPYDIRIKPGETQIIRTGIRCHIPNDYVLLLVVRSSMGIKKHMQLANTIGVIDSDYYYSDNQGHIMLALTNNNPNSNCDFVAKAGTRLVQGIFVPFGITEDDITNNERNGGFGSTG